MSPQPSLTSALPVWRQSLIMLPNGVEDAQWFNDCGETCLAMALAAIRGTPVSPASIRANLGGPGRSGITSGNDLVAMARYYHLPAHVENAPPAALQAWLTTNAKLQRPSIVLGTWPTPGNVLHWMLTT